MLISDLYTKLWLEGERYLITTSVFWLCVDSYMCGLSINHYICKYAHGWFMDSSFMVWVQGNQPHGAILIALYVWRNNPECAL